MKKLAIVMACVLLLGGLAAAATNAVAWYSVTGNLSNQTSYAEVTWDVARLGKVVTNVYVTVYSGQVWVKHSTVTSGYTIAGVTTNIPLETIVSGGATTGTVVFTPNGNYFQVKTTNAPNNIWGFDLQ